MRKVSLLLLFLFPVFICACDSERNRIIRDFLITPTATVTPLPPTPTATQTPLPTATPTELPGRTLKEAESLIQFGYYEKAQDALKDTYDPASQSELSLESAYDLAMIAYKAGNAKECKMLLEDSGIKETGTFLSSAALYLDAECSAELDDRQGEISSLKKYLELMPETSLRNEILQRIADSYLELNDGVLAREVYSRILDTDESNRLKSAKALLIDGQTDEAISELQSLLEGSPSEYVQAEACKQLGDIYFDRKETEQAYDYYQQTINRYPSYGCAYEALLRLVEMNRYVSEYQRGLVDYYAGQYAMAAQAFHRYIKSEPGHDGSSYYFIGLCRMYLAQYDEAETAFRTLIEKYPENRYFVSCWDELAYLQWYYKDQHRKGAETLLSFVKLHPDHSDAAGFLYEAGRDYERGSFLVDAAKTWGRLIDEYPLYERSTEALFFSAISYYRAKEYDSAMASLNRLLTISGEPSEMAKADFWLAKVCDAKGDSYRRDKYFTEAYEAAPMEYYGMRAKELLDKKAPFTLPLKFDFSVDLAEEQGIAEQWMLLNFDLDPSDLRDTGPFSSDPQYLKGLEYYSVGDYEAARNCFEDVRERLAENPGASFAFLQKMLERGIYYTASYAARQILTAAGLIENARTYDVPNYFNHIRFGLWYQSDVLEASEKYGLSPLFLYAVIRQESMFDPWVVSFADARGLMQIMPATGADIAKNLHWPANYSEKDLNRVPIAVNFGASYLSRQKAYFDGNHFAMISAYNAGPGNTSIWTELSGGDLDLFVEIVRIEETRNYIHNIYEFAKMYERLYGR